jgi:succinoglycan biosynthesis protein ExoM
MDLTQTPRGARERSSVAVYVCTFRRNEPLAVLLDALGVAAERVADSADVAVVVVDDNPDGRARAVVDACGATFSLGLHYENPASSNISIARNTGLETAGVLADWVAMTDDDCEPSPHWLEALLDVATRTGAGAVTGPLELRLPPGSPAWLSDQPFLLSGLQHEADGAEVPVAATHNSMISSRFLAEHPELRFRPDLGVLGGEDMVFFRAAREAGLHIRFARHAVVFGNEPPERCTFGHQIRTHLWLGNTEAVTNLHSGTTGRARLALRGANYLRKVAARTFGRLARREPPQWRYAVALCAHGIGVLAGAAGAEVRHH